MEYRNLGRSGVKVSEICLGTMTFGKSVDQSEATKIVDLAFEAGVNFFDTADAYNHGASEEILGKVIKDRRQSAIIASKFYNPMGKGPNDGGMSRVHIMQAIESSLKRIGLDYLDIYYIHHLDQETPLEEMLRTLDDLVHQGKVRYIACSNYEAWRLLEALWISETRNLYRFECFQPQYNLVVRDIEQDIIPVCKLKNLGVVTYSPLASGFLSGKYKPGERKVKGTRSEEGWSFSDLTWSPNADEILKALLDASEELGRSPAQVAIRWVLEQPAISSVIIGARSVEQVRDNLHAGGWKLPPEINARLCEVSTLPDRYPNNFEKAAQKRRADGIQMPSLPEE